MSIYIKSHFILVMYIFDSKTLICPCFKAFVSFSINWNTMSRDRGFKKVM